MRAEAEMDSKQLKGTPPYPHPSKSGGFNGSTSMVFATNSTASCENPKSQSTSQDPTIQGKTRHQGHSTVAQLRCQRQQRGAQLADLRLSPGAAVGDPSQDLWRGRQGDPGVLPGSTGHQCELADVRLPNKMKKRSQQSLHICF